VVSGRCAGGRKTLITGKRLLDLEGPVILILGLVLRLVVMQVVRCKLHTSVLFLMGILYIFSFCCCGSEKEETILGTRQFMGKRFGVRAVPGVSVHGIGLVVGHEMEL
jgi:hypothetical protein